MSVLSDWVIIQMGIQSSHGSISFSLYLQLMDWGHDNNASHALRGCLVWSVEWCIMILIYNNSPFQWHLNCVWMPLAWPKVKNLPKRYPNECISMTYFNVLIWFIPILEITFVPYLELSVHILYTNTIIIYIWHQFKCSQLIGAFSSYFKFFFSLFWLNVPFN